LSANKSRLQQEATLQAALAMCCELQTKYDPCFIKSVSCAAGSTGCQMGSARGRCQGTV
jgi:hypothetical protein